MTILPLVPADLPADPDEKNQRRAETALAAVEAFASMTGQSIETLDAAEEVWADLLCNLRHLADRLGVDYELAVDRADYHYTAETTEAEAG